MVMVHWHEIFIFLVDVSRNRIISKGILESFRESIKFGVRLMMCKVNWGRMISVAVI